MISSALVPRQRSLMPIGQYGYVEGWMDDDVASAATQLFGSGPRGMLVIDARELLTSTARVVGAQLGELHFKIWMAMITLHVAHGMPPEGRAVTTAGELSRLVWGADRARGGSNTRKLLRTLFDLRQTQFTVPGYDLVNQCPAPGVSDTSLLINLYVDDTILTAFTEAVHHIDRTGFGQALGAKRSGTIAWRLHPDYAQRLADADLRRFDWTKAQRLRGVALALWLVFTSPRVPYRTVYDGGQSLEMVDVPLTVEHCHALGVHAATDAARRRTLSEAGQRMCAADKSFVLFEAHGGRGSPSFLRVLRTPTQVPSAERPMGGPQKGSQLQLAA